MSKWNDCQISSSLTPPLLLSVSLHGGFACKRQKHQSEVSPCDQCWGREWLSDTALYSIVCVEHILVLTMWTDTEPLVTDARCLL